MYHSFGMNMPGRTYSAGSAYRYGFNGKEKSDEIAFGDLDFGERIYDGRIGRFFSNDPMTKNYPDLNPYHFTGNSPILFGDYDGKDYGVIYDHENKTVFIVANYYVLKGEEEYLTKAVELWNKTKGTSTDGYTIRFELKVKPVEVKGVITSREHFLALNPHLKEKGEEIVDRAMQADLDQALHTMSKNDPIGNAYFGSDFYNSKGQDASSYELIAGVTLADYIYMNFVDDGSANFGERPDLIAHEIGHTLGLQDKPKSDGKPKPYYSEGGIMDYVLRSTQKKINNNDAQTIIKYAAHQFASKFDPFYSFDEHSSDRRAEVAYVMSVEFLKRMVAFALSGIDPEKIK